MEILFMTTNSVFKRQPNQHVNKFVMKLLPELVRIIEDVKQKQ